jgi:putative RecB family exonuclease
MTTELKMGKHLSVTQLKMYLRCPLQYKFRYIDELKIPPSSEITLGKSIHTTLEENYKQKINTRQNLSLEYITDVFSDIWERSIKDTFFSEDEKPGKIKDEGIKLVKTYHENIAPNIQPAYVEREFNLPLAGLDYTLKGFIDLIDEHGVIIDHKTTKRLMQENVVVNDLQLTAYAFAYRLLEKRQEKGLRFDVMVRTKQPKIQQITTTRSEHDINRLFRIIKHVSKAIESELFYPNVNPMCPACGYSSLCKKWGL